jgi:hypothetical protein
LVQVRLSWAAFSPAPKIFLWKSPDRTEKILRMGATRRGKLRTFSRPEVDFEQVLSLLVIVEGWKTQVTERQGQA